MFWPGKNRDRTEVVSRSFSKEEENCSGRKVSDRRRRCQEGVEQVKVSEINSTVPATFPDNGLLHMLVYLSLSGSHSVLRDL